MTLPQDSWTNLALQIPLALVIVFLIIVIIRYADKAASSILLFLERQSTAVLGFMEKQAQLNRDFLAAQQEAHSQSIARLAEEIKSNRVDTVRELANLTQRVDSVVDKAIMLERLLPERSVKK